jgi:hypothetical protein
MDATGPNHPSGGTRAHQPLSTSLRATLSDLSDEISQHLADANLDGHMPQFIHRVARQARIDGLRAEQVVVAFGNVWDNLPGAGHARESRRDEIRWSVVSALITAYYEHDPGATRSPA